MKNRPVILIVDDNKDYEPFLLDIRRNIRDTTGNRIAVEELIGVRLAEALSLVEAKVAEVHARGDLVYGILLDVVDRDAGNALGGLILLRALRRSPITRDLKIILTTTKGNLESVDVGDEIIISRMWGDGPIAATEKLLKIFDLGKYIL